MKQDKQIITTLPSVMGFEIQELVSKGWTIDPEMPVAQVGFNWECGFVRDATPEQLAEDGKPTRAEILSKARAAKALKQAEEKGTE